MISRSGYGEDGFKCGCGRFWPCEVMGPANCPVTSKEHKYWCIPTRASFRSGSAHCEEVIKLRCKLASGVSLAGVHFTWLDA